MAQISRRTTAGFTRLFQRVGAGAAYSILLMTLVVPYIASLTATTPLGGEKKRRFARAKKEGGE